MPQITGQTLYEALFAACPDLAYTWRDLGANDRQIYEQTATALNTQHLAPLQGLVRDYRALAVEVDDAATIAFDDGLNYVHMDIDWEEERNRLNLCAEQLLKDEQKEG